MSVPTHPSKLPSTSDHLNHDQIELTTSKNIHHESLSKSSFLRIVFIGLSCLSLSIGVIGLFVPGLPTVEFVLLAAFFAGKGSSRLHRWFYQHKLFGPMIRNWQDQRQVSRKSKYMMAVSMTLASCILILHVPHFWFNLVCIVCMLLVFIWVWRRPEPEKI